MRHLTLILLLLLYIPAQAQQNLVPNPSFEDTLFCPQYLNQIEAANSWFNFGNTPDYYNVCNPIFNMPDMPFGYQYPRSGVGMAGIVSYRNPAGPNGPNYREFFAAPLIISLTVGVKYYFTMFVNCANTNNYSLATNKLGARFSVYQHSQFDEPAINNFAHIYMDVILDDTLSWTKISGSFFADSNYTYIMVGNFFDDINTDTNNLGLFFDYSYYYVDDICVSTDSVFAQNWTALPDLTYLPCLMFPNPSPGFIKFSNSSNDDYIKIFDQSGRLLISRKLSNKNETYSLDDISSGLYFCHLFRRNKLFFKYKLILTR
ncbi:hypothetical protein BH11BAC2_BH11BAC2_00640 [soil metagenome]